MAKAELQEMVSAGTLALLVMIMVSSAFCTNVNYLITKHNCTLPAAQNCMLPLKLLTCPGASAHLPLPSLSLHSPPHLQKWKRGGALCKVWSIELWKICATWGLRFCETAALSWIMTANKVSYCLNFRCHALVAVQGVEQRPQTIGNFNQVLVQLRNIP